MSPRQASMLDPDLERKMVEHALRAKADQVGRDASALAALANGAGSMAGRRLALINLRRAVDELAAAAGLR